MAGAKIAHYKSDQTVYDLSLKSSHLVWHVMNKFLFTKSTLFSTPR
jgi:hypothetical protein